MRLLLVEDKHASVLGLVQTAQSERGWNTSFHAPNLSKEDDSIRDFLRYVYVQRPDVVILDIALSEEEEKLFDYRHVEAESLREDDFGGFRYCHALRTERINTPVVFYTRCAGGHVARMAMKVGGNSIIVKSKAFSVNDVLDEVEAVAKRAAPHDAAFYLTLSAFVEENREGWYHDTIKRALNYFFTTSSSVRRFSLFCASLRPTLSNILKGDADMEQQLVLKLVRSQVLLSLVDPRLRDHTRHTGNVFWLGFYLLHVLPIFSDPAAMPGYSEHLYGTDGELTKPDHLFYAWTLASLFHDFGYGGDDPSRLISLWQAVMPDTAIPSGSDAPLPEGWDASEEELSTFVANVAGDGHFLKEAIRWAFGRWGRPTKAERGQAQKSGNAGTRRFYDHGILSAHRLLTAVRPTNLSAEKRRIVLHAAAAIALHNYVGMIQKWDMPQKAVGTVPIGLFPVLGLLCLCDNLQTWDRELELDPAMHEVERDLTERLILSQSPSVRGSEITQFDVQATASTGQASIDISVRYFLQYTGDVDAVSLAHAEAIQRWIDEDKLKDVVNTMGLSDFVSGRIVYQIPMIARPPVAEF